MRISGGVLKGRKIGARKIFSGKSESGELRPTSSKVREALFDILRNEIEGASFLDLYAGSGTVGFEAVSRGAGKACFVENDPRRSMVIKEIITKTGIGDQASIQSEPVTVFLRRAAMAGLQFDIIFADPPYASAEIIEVLSEIDAGSVLREGGSLVVEHSAKKTLDDSGMLTLRLIKNYRYGDTVLTRYRRVT